MVDTKLLKDRVLLKKREDLEKPKKIGLIELPKDTVINKRETKVAEIIKLGPGKTIKGEVKTFGLVEGETVYYGRYGNTQIDLESEGYLMCHEPSILATINFIDGKIKRESIEPRNDRMLVVPFTEGEYERVEGNAESFSARKAEGSNLLLVDASNKKEEILKYIVITVGPGAIDYDTGKREPTTLKPGDLVYAEKLSGAILTLWDGPDKEEYRLLKESECMCYERN